MVSFEDVYFDFSPSTFVTFQVVLYEGSNTIGMNYKEGYTFGDGSTSAGIQDGNGNGLQFQPFLTAGSYNNFSVRYSLEPAVPGVIPAVILPLLLMD